jgi:hypothetical protein
MLDRVAGNLRSEIRKGKLGLQTLSASHNIKETVRRIKGKARETVGRDRVAL